MHKVTHQHTRSNLHTYIYIYIFTTSPQSTDAQRVLSSQYVLFELFPLCVCVCSTPVLVLRDQARLWPLLVPAWRSSAVLRSSSVTAVEPATTTPTPTASGSPPLKTMRCLRKAEALTFDSSCFMLQSNCDDVKVLLLGVLMGATKHTLELKKVLCCSFNAVIHTFPPHLLRILVIKVEV